MRRTAPRRFAIRYSAGLYPLFLVLGMGRRFSRVELDEEELRVVMGWAFRGGLPRRSIRAAKAGGWRWLGIGVHSNLRFDVWLVNGSAKGVVWLDIEPKARAHVFGIPVKARRLGLGLEDPEGFLRELGVPAAP